MYSYDILGRMIDQQTWSTQNSRVVSQIALEYDDVDQIVAKDYRHLGVRQTFAYNLHGELTEDACAGNSNWGGSGSNAAGLHGTTFTNLIGDPGTGNESNPSDEGQVLSESSSILVSAMSVPAWDHDFTYDSGGNRTSSTLGGVTSTYTYNSGSQLTQVVRGQVTETYSYDTVGNLVEKVTTQSGQPTITEEYTYDYMNRMASYANSSTGAAWTYQHWPTGDRFEKVNLTSGARFLSVPRFGDTSVEYTQASETASVEFANRYVQGLGIDSKATRIPATGGRRHFVGDQVGSLSVTLDDAGSRVEQCVRDSYGSVIAGDTNDERFGFAQREHDTESGLVYMRHRMYDPRVGRFTQMDPMLGNRPLKHYVYASNSPITRIDPMGLDDQDWKEFLEAARKAGLKFRPRTVARDTDLKWNAAESDLNHYTSFNNTIYLNPSFRDARTGKLKRFADLTATQINTIYHELFHAAWDQVYEEYRDYDPTSAFYRDSSSLRTHAKEEEAGNLPMAPGDQMTLAEEKLAAYAGNAAMAFVTIDRAISHVGRDSIVDEREYEFLKDTTKRMSGFVKSTRGSVEPGKLWQHPTVTESVHSVTKQMADYINQYYFGGMYDFLEMSSDPDVFLMRSGFKYDRVRKTWAKGAE